MKEYITAKGTKLPLLDIKGKDYLSVQQRLRWFREEHPDFSIETEFVFIKENEAMAKATIKDASGRILSTAHKVEDKKGFQDFCEKSETSAVGRALGLLGYGTQFCVEFEEGQRLADAPTNEVEKNSLNSTQVDPSFVLPRDPHFIPHVSQGSLTRPLDPQQNPTSDSSPESLVITFGKYQKAGYKTIGQVLSEKGPGDLERYCVWLEADSRDKKKPLGQKAIDFIEAARAAIAMRGFGPPPPPKENFMEQIGRLKNSFGPNNSSPEAPSFEEPFPEDQIPF